jgi:hypothetical protein
MVCLAMMLASGCVTTGPAPSPTDSRADVFCRTQKPIILNDAAIDALDDQAARDLNSFDEFGRVHCGWKSLPRGN